MTPSKRNETAFRGDWTRGEGIGGGFHSRREKERGFRKRSSPLFEFFGIEKISWIHRIGGEGGKKMESSEDATVASFE